LEKSHGIWSWREEGSRRAGDFQGLLSPSSSMVHPNEQKVKQEWQKACIDEQGTPD